MRRLLALVVLVGCDGFFRAPDPGLERMLEQPRVDTYEQAPRSPPAGVIRYGERPFVRPARSRALLERGRVQFATFCAPCHGADGRGDTPVARHMERKPPESLLGAEIRAMSLEEIVRVVAEGRAWMPGFSAQLVPEDRWAVAEWTRVLQRAGHAPVDQMPAGIRQRFEEATR